MGNRLSSIVTKTGDKGSTGMADGSRRPKNDIRVRCLGEVDELNATIGVAMTFIKNDSTKNILSQIQHDLFDFGAELCQPGKSLITDEYVEAIERIADDLNQPLPPLKEFILPGGSQAVAFIHLARTVCRRVERLLVELGDAEFLNEATASYINRLSDLLFIMSRSVAREDGHEEIHWNSSYSRLSK